MRSSSLVVSSVLFLAACGGAGVAPQDARQAFEEAGVEFTENELADGRPRLMSDSDEDLIVELIGGETVEKATVAIFGLNPSTVDAEGTFPGSRYIEVLDETFAPGIQEWAVEELRTRAGGSWSATEEFNGWTAEAEMSDAMGNLFSLSVARADE